MKILVVTHNNNEKSGGNRSLISVLTQLKDRHEIDVICNGAKGGLPDVVRSLGLKCMIADYDWIAVSNAPDRKDLDKRIDKLKAQYKKTLKQVPEFAAGLRKNRYDLVYTNTGAVCFGVMLADQLHIPHIWHLREFGDKDFDFEYIFSREKRIEFFKKAYCVITVSNALRNDYIRKYGLNNAVTVYNGLETETMKYKAEPKLHQPIRILISGQVTKNKGHDQAIKAVAMLREKYDIELNIAGGGGQSFLESEMAALSDSSFIRILGQVDNMYELRKDMDMELVCSRCEAFGRVTIEAMLHSLPLVASATGGTVELVQNGKNGLLYKYDNVEQLAAQIEKLILDEKLRNEITAYAYDYAQAFDIKRTADSVEQVFLEAAKKNKWRRVFRFLFAK